MILLFFDGKFSDVKVWEVRSPYAAVFQMKLSIFIV